MSASIPVLKGDITDNIIAEIRGNIGWLTFNDPARHNAISLAMWEAVPKVLERFAGDDDIRAVVLTGAGEKAFVSGANISQFDSLRTGDQAVAHYEQAAEGAQAAIYDFPKPTVARVRGYCIGGGLNLALCCDVRIASDDSSFAIPAGRLGLGYRFNAIRNLVNTVGPAQALEIFLTAQRYDARQALDKGLVHQVVPAADLDEAVGATVEKIAGNAPLTLQAGKKMIRELMAPDARIDTDAMMALVMACYRSEDYREGKRAFAEKRPPVFKGR